MITRKTAGGGGNGESKVSSGPGANGDGNSNLSSIMSLGDDTGASRTAVASAREAAGGTRRAAVKSVEDIANLVEQAGGRSREVIREKIMSADFDAVKTLADQEEADFAAALQSLSEIASGMDIQFKSLLELSPEEKSLVETAKRRVTELEQQIAKKQAGVNWFWRRDKVVADLQVALEAARSKVTETEAKAAELMRQRLMTAKMDESIKAYMKVSGKTIDIMTARVLEVAAQIKMLGDRRIDSLKQKAEAAESMKKLNEELAKRELDLKGAEVELEGLINGTPEYAAKEQEISTMRVEVEQTRGNKDVSLALFQSKELFVQRLELSLHTAMKLRDRHKARIVRLKSDTEERVATYEARLVTMKVIADQKFDELIDGIGVTLDQKTDEYMASAMVAADDALMRSFEAQPGKLDDHNKVRALVAEHIQKIRERGDRVEADLRRRYGIDPGEASFFRYADEKKPDEPGADNGAGGPPRT